MTRCLVVLLLLPVLAACSPQLRPTSKPIGQQWFVADDKTAVAARQLLILLPGINGQLEDFERFGFIDQVQKHFPATDVVLVDAHFAYYRERLILDRLQQDIITPARQDGYCAIHLGGISLGGFGALLYYRAHSDQIDSVTLLAPYLGEDVDYQYLLDDSKHTPDSMTDRNLWPWLAGLPDQQKSSIYLAYGRQDKFAVSNGLLAKMLGDSNVITRDGSHLWQTWQVLWREGIAAGVLPPLHRQSCQAKSATDPG